MTEIARLVATGGILVDALGAAPVDQIGLTSEAGPGTTPLGELPEAVRFGPGARAQLTATPTFADRERFALRVVFAARGAVDARQNLIEATHVPAVLWIEPDPADAGSVRVGSGVQVPSGAWRTVVSDTSLKIDQWHTVALVMDDDVLAAIDEGAGTLLSAVAVPEATLGAATGSTLSVGTLPDGIRLPFTGDIAAVSWVDDVPTSLDTLVDDWRMSPDGVIDAKRWTLPFDAGAPLGSPEWHPASTSTVRRFANADIFYSEDAGNAFEMHGDIRAEYRKLEFASLLGFPVSDEIDGRAGGVRKNLFSEGAIYWSQPTGALPVFEEIYVAYESAGEARILGAPTEAEEEVPGGLVQRFAGGEIYLANGSSTAFEVHGGILTQFLATGGLSTWGFPTTNELPILQPGGAEIGRYSRFRNGTFYWSPATGAHSVYGAIGAYYVGAGGASGRLGFPTSDETDLPDAPAARYNTFEHGVVFWYADAGISEPTPLRVFVDTVDTKEDEGLGRGQNDLTIDVGLLRDGVGIDGFQDATSGHNIRPLKRALGAQIEPWPGRVYTLRVDVHERDPEDRPRLGLWEKRLDAGNGWGLRENNGILNSGNFSGINSITASVAGAPPAAGFTTAQRHWGTKNPSTAEISRRTFATAFPEVDSEPEWWDVLDGIESIYYELVSKGLSGNGNCVGFSAEGILAEKGSSLYQLPLDRFTLNDWPNGLEKTINVRHQSQVGSSAVWAFVALFLTGNTHDPVDVFRMTRAAAAVGQDPVMCLAQNYDFGGAPHAVRPIAWRDGGAQWEIDVLDPNFTGTTRTITIDPTANTFAYAGASSYSGGEWSGGRLYFLPFSSFAGTAELPIWDALRLILGGTIAILGDGDAVTAVTSPEGENLLLTGAPTKDSPQGSGVGGFVPVPDYARGLDPERLRDFREAVRIRPGAVDHVIRDDLRVDEGLRFGDIIGAEIAERMSVATGVLARARREPSTSRRGPRGGHRGIRDIVQGLDIPEFISVRERPRREELRTKIKDIAKVRFDDNPVFLRDLSALETAVESSSFTRFDVARAAMPRVEFDQPDLAVEQDDRPVRDTLALRENLAVLATRLPAGIQRDAVVELAADDSPLGKLTDGAFQKRIDAEVITDIGGIIKRLYSDDFILDTVSLGGSPGRIAIAHGLREYVVRHDGRAGSALRIAGQNLRTVANTLSVAPGTGRRVTLTVTNRIGMQGDVVQARFVDLPAESAAPLTLNVRPGLARWELAGETLEGAARAVVSGVIAGKRFGASYDLTLQSALRIQFPLAADAARLSVATTKGLFSDIIDVTKISPS